MRSRYEPLICLLLIFKFQQRQSVLIPRHIYLNSLLLPRNLFKALSKMSGLIPIYTESALTFTLSMIQIRMMGKKLDVFWNPIRKVILCRSDFWSKVILINGINKSYTTVCFGKHSALNLQIWFISKHFDRVWQLYFCHGINQI